MKAGPSVKPYFVPLCRNLRPYQAPKPTHLLQTNQTPTSRQRTATTGSEPLKMVCAEMAGDIAGGPRKKKTTPTGTPLRRLADL